MGCVDSVGLVVCLVAGLVGWSCCACIPGIGGVGYKNAGLTWDRCNVFKERDVDTRGFKLMAQFAKDSGIIRKIVFNLSLSIHRVGI